MNQRRILKRLATGFLLLLLVGLICIKPILWIWYSVSHRERDENYRRTMARAAECIEQYHASNKTYPEKLSEIADCVKNASPNPPQDWEDRLKYLRPLDPEAAAKHGILFYESDFIGARTVVVAFSSRRQQAFSVLFDNDYTEFLRANAVADPFRE